MYLELYPGDTTFSDAVRLTFGLTLFTCLVEFPICDTGVVLFRWLRCITAN